MKITIEGKRGEGKTEIARRIAHLLHAEMKFNVTIKSTDSSENSNLEWVSCNGSCDILIKQTT